MQKGCFAVVGVLFGAVVGGIVLIFALTRDVVKSGDDFVNRLGAGDFAGAYALTSAQFQNKTTPEQFAEFAKEEKLDQAKSVFWNSRSFENQRGELIGTVTTRDGRQIPIAIELVKEGEKWLIAVIRDNGAGIQPARVEGAPGKQAPPQPELERLVLETLESFNNALQLKSFQAFHHNASKPLREQLSAGQLQQKFQQFIDRKIDISYIGDSKVIIETPPVIDEDGVLSVVGRYPTKPTQVEFDLDYLYEEGQWRVIGIHVTAEPAKDTESEDRKQK